MSGRHPWPPPKSELQESVERVQVLEAIKDAAWTFPNLRICQLFENALMELRKEGEDRPSMDYFYNVTDQHLIRVLRNYVSVHGRGDVRPR